MPEIAPPILQSDVKSELNRRLKTRDAARHLGLGESTLEKYRVFGGGPTYEKLGKSVVYTIGELERWARARQRTNTSRGQGEAA